MKYLLGIGVVTLALAMALPSSAKTLHCLEVTADSKLTSNPVIVKSNAKSFAIANLKSQSYSFHRDGPNGIKVSMAQDKKKDNVFIKIEGGKKGDMFQVFNDRTGEPVIFASACDDGRVKTKS